MKIELGKRYKDKVSGFEGIACGKSQWLTGCESVGLQPGIDKDGKLPDLTWIDSVRLGCVDEVEPVTVDPGNDPGGPHDSPPQMTHK